ncbi:MAG: multidrug RND transporter, partial [Xanthomonadaceae bacterium]|nr:multidrug RND transporter [Xanthomonadaceae bacterium]
MTPQVSRHRLGIAVALTAAVLAGCAGTGGLRSDAAPMRAGSLHAEQSLAGVKLDATAWPREDWWKAIGDTQLDKLVDEAL